MIASSSLGWSGSWNDEVKPAVRERRLLGSRCWLLVMKRQKIDVWKLTEKKRERLKCVYIRAKKKVNEHPSNGLIIIVYF